MIGGMGAAGNLALHDGQSGSHPPPLTGLANNFSLLNAAYYNVTHQVAQPESFVANASFYEMLHGAGVKKIALDCRLLSAAGGNKGRVESIKVLCEPEPVTATVFIDASYDGEVMVAVGTVEYTSGREASSKYNESLAGARKPTPSSTVVNALRDDGTIIKYVQNLSELAAPGDADDALMAFQHRMCISGDADRLPWTKPDGCVSMMTIRLRLAASMPAHIVVCRCTLSAGTIATTSCCSSVTSALRAAPSMASVGRRR